MLPSTNLFKKPGKKLKTRVPWFCANLSAFMQVKILKSSQENLWEKFVETHALGTIHQTPGWGHFQEKIPSRGKYWIVVLEDSSAKITGGTLLVRHQLPKGHCWLYCPRGPLLDYGSKNEKQQMDLLLSEIKKITKQENAIFLRIDPPLLPDPLLSQQLLESGTFKDFRPTNFGFQPEHTLTIDLTKSEEEILNQMKPKGRYNIRLAEKKGVKIFKSESPAKDISEFYKLLQQTTKRDEFSSHDEQFYRTMVQELAPGKPQNGYSNLYFASYNDQILAGVIVTYFRSAATYYYGASSNEFRNLMAPYLLHWKIMLDAKAAGYKFYDLFGIAPDNAKNHPWQGVTEFKCKFGGEEISYQKAREFAFSKGKHFLYRIYKKLR